MRFLRSPQSAGSNAQPRRRPWRTYARRTLVGGAGLCALLLVAVVLVLHSLDQPWLKRRVVALVHSSAGVDIDYRAARVDIFSGAEVGDLVVRSPAELRGFAPDLLRVTRLEARWSLGALVSGRAPRIDLVRVSGMTLATVVDENGKSSFDALFPPSPPGSKPDAGPKTPLSGQAAKLLAEPPPLRQVDIEDVTLTLVRTEKGAVSERTELRGLALTLAARALAPVQVAPAHSSPPSSLAPTEGWRLDARLGSPEGPLDLTLARALSGTEPKVARAKLWMTLGAGPTGLEDTLDLRMVSQSFAASVSPQHWLHAKADVHFDPAAGLTAITLDHVEAGDGAVTADAKVEVPDAGDPVVVHARADVDVARLIHWLPEGLISVTAERARLRCEVRSLVVGPVVRLSKDGTVAADAEVTRVVVGTAAGPLDVARGEFAVHARHTEQGGGAAQGSLKVTGVRLGANGERALADEIALDLDATRDVDETLRGTAELRVSRGEREGASSIVARDAHVAVRIDGLRQDVANPIATRGEVSISAGAALLDVRSPAARTHVEGVSARAHTQLAGDAPYALDIEALASRLRIQGTDGRTLADVPVRLEGKARDVRPDVARPEASRGILAAKVALGNVTMQASLDATKAADAIDFGLGATLPSLEIVRPFVPPDLGERVPWDEVSASVRSTGHLEHFDAKALAIRQKTEIDLERPRFGDVVARSLALTLASQGTALRHHADVDLRSAALRFDDEPPSDDHVTLSLDVDREAPSLGFELATEGRAQTELSGSFSFDPSQRAIVYESKGRLAGLAPLAPFTAKVGGLEAVDLSGLEVDLALRGALLGVVASVARGGTLTLEPDPAQTAAAHGKVDLRLSHFRWAKGDTAILTPAVAWNADMRVEGARRVIDSRFEVGTLHVESGNHDVDLNGVGGEGTAAVTGALTAPEIAITQRLSVAAVVQDLVPEYPLGDLTLSLSGDRSAEGVVHLSEAKVANGAGGTALALAGNIDLSEGRRTLALTTSLTQDLARLSTTPDRFRGRGDLSVEATVTSPDLARYTVRAVAKGKDVSVTVPRSGIEVDTADGEVPVTVALEIDDKGARLQRTEKRSPYSMLRFADQHPLLAHSGFLSVRRLKTPLLSIAPLVGNIEIDQNALSLRQFEMGIRGGTITGQCGVDWDGPRSNVELHVRASGVQSSHGEPFDGNISVAISGADRTIDGRAEILRIGERHLLDLLDLQDPLHVDPGMNRIRSALVFGHPDSMRMVFDHGFASAHLELGGLARFISIGDLRGIPMGPVVDRVIASMLEGADTKEAP